MKILLAVDDSKFSDAALQVVITQIPPQGTEVLVLHVVGPITLSSPPQMSAGYAPELESRVKDGRELVKREAQRLRAVAA